jgi:hypothetical protein
MAIGEGGAEGEQGELVLAFFNERPLPVAELGGVFQVIASDYRRFSKGRELVVYRLTEGSLWAFLRDAAEWISGANSLIEFGQNLVGLFKSLDSESSPPKRTTGLRTIETLAKTGSSTGSRIRFSYKRSFFRGEEAAFEIEPGEAPKIEAKALLARRPPGRKSARFAIQDHEAAALELTRLGRSGESAAVLTTIARALVAAGAGHLVLEIARRLEAEGHVEAARQLRRAESVRSDRRDPPLLT